VRLPWSRPYGPACEFPAGPDAEAKAGDVAVREDMIVLGTLKGEAFDRLLSKLHRSRRQRRRAWEDHDKTGATFPGPVLHSLDCWST
jgi:hypothetical protein